MGKLNSTMTLTIGLLFLIVGIIIYIIGRNNGLDTIEISNAFIIGIGIIITIIGLIKFIKEKREDYE